MRRSPTVHPWRPILSTDVDLEQSVSTRDAAALLSVDPSTVRKLVHAGELVEHRVGLGKDIRLPDPATQ
jgi:excisionase family DNA binding protein